MRLVSFLTDLVVVDKVWLNFARLGAICLIIVSLFSAERVESNADRRGHKFMLINSLCALIDTILSLFQRIGNQSFLIRLLQLCLHLD